MLFFFLKHALEKVLALILIAQAATEYNNIGRSIVRTFVCCFTLRFKMFNRFSFLAAVVKIYRCSVILSYYEWYYIVDRKSVDYGLYSITDYYFFFKQFKHSY